MDRAVVHGSTFAKNDLAMAAGIATLDVIKQERLVEQAAKRGAELRLALTRMVPGYELMKEVRGKGLMIGIEFDTPDQAEEVQWAAFQRGLLVLECGRSSVRLSPALTVSEAEMSTALRIFGEAVAEVAAEPAEVRAEAAAAGAISGVEAGG
jgi:4-aminobutyrate aminotransferase-like enzyme